MNKKIIIAIGIILLGLLAKNLINTDEKEIRELAKNIEEKASFKEEQLHPFIYLQKGKELASHFKTSTNIEIQFDDELHAKIIGHEQVIKNYTITRNHLKELSVDFDNLKIKINDQKADIKTTIVVGITRKGSKEKELYAEPIIISVEKDHGEWLVTKIKNVELLEK